MSIVRKEAGAGEENVVCVPPPPAHRPQVKFLKLHPDAVIPSYAHGSDNDAGMDLVALEDALVQTGHVALVKTGIAVELPPGYEGQIRPRSGLACKHLITVMNAPGTVDPSYRGEIIVALVKHGWHPYTVHKGDRIAQFIIAPYARCEVIEVEALAESARGEKGFGSTGR